MDRRRGGRIVSALNLRPHEQAVLLDALRRYEEAEVRTGDLDDARIADRLRDHFRRGGSVRAIPEVPAA